MFVLFIQKSTFIFGLIKALVGWPELFHKKITTEPKPKQLY